jgi:hypothetical protein
MPLLLRGLDLSDLEVRANVIDTFISAVGSESNEHSAVSEHASTLVFAMLKNSVASEVPSIVGNARHLLKVNSIMSPARSCCGLAVPRHLTSHCAV